LVKYYERIREKEKKQTAITTTRIERPLGDASEKPA